VDEVKPAPIVEKLLINHEQLKSISDAETVARVQ